MKFKTDENLPIEVADDLRQAGHDVVTVTDQHLAGQPDLRVADVSRAEARAILTLDLDFADIRVYPPKDYAGIVVLRPSVQTIPNVRRLVQQVIALSSSGKQRSCRKCPFTTSAGNVICVMKWLTFAAAVATSL